MHSLACLCCCCCWPSLSLARSLDRSLAQTSCERSSSSSWWRQRQLWCSRRRCRRSKFLHHPHSQRGPTRAAVSAPVGRAYGLAPPPPPAMPLPLWLLSGVRRTLLTDSTCQSVRRERSCGTDQPPKLCSTCHLARPLHLVRTLNFGRSTIAQYSIAGATRIRR